MKLTGKLKEQILKALKEDENFRWSVAGLIGYKDILERIVRLEERQQILEERFAELEKRFARIEERQQKMEKEFRYMFNALATRVGIITEEMFRESLKYFLEEEFKTHKVEKVILEDDGSVTGIPSSTVEIDVVVKDSIHYLIEVKSSLDKYDIYKLFNIRELYKKVKKIKNIKLIAFGVIIQKDAIDVAKKLNIEIREIAGK